MLTNLFFAGEISIWFTCGCNVEFFVYYDYDIEHGDDLSANILGFDLCPKHKHIDMDMFNIQEAVKYIFSKNKTHIGKIQFIKKYDSIKLNKGLEDFIKIKNNIIPFKGR